MDVLLSIDALEGEIRVEERDAEKNDKDYYDSKKILYVDNHDNVCLDVVKDSDGIRINISTHHIQDPESTIIYHVQQNAKLDIEIATAIRDYLSFLIHNWETT